MGCGIPKQKQHTAPVQVAPNITAAVLSQQPQPQALYLPNLQPQLKPVSSIMSNPTSDPSSIAASKCRMVKKMQKINGRYSISEERMHENVVKVEQSEALLEANRVALGNILRGHFYFYNILEDERAEIIKKMQLCSGQPGTYIFKQGDPASAFFIIHQGTVQVQINGQAKKIMKKGQYFGQLALIYMAARSASIKVLSPSLFWVITRSQFKKTLQTTVRKNYSTAKLHINNLPLFSFLTEQQKDAIAYSMISLKYLEGEVIFKEFDDANSFYIILEGSVEIFIKGKSPLMLKSGDSFGEQSFLENQYRSGTAVARGRQTGCLSIGREAVKEILGDQITNIIYYNISKWAIKRSQVLSKLSNIEIEKLLQTSKLLQVQDGQVIFQKHSKFTKIVICLQGSVSGKPPGTVIAQQFIKTGGLIQKQFIKQGTGMISVITLQDLQRTLNKTLTDIVQKGYALTHEKLMVQEVAKQDYSHITLEKMVFLKKLGEGQFGKVYLVKDSQSGQLFAIKCISKQQVIQTKMQPIILQQRNILSSVNSPFLLRFYRSFKDSSFIYFLTQYIKGCQLFDTIRQIGLLSRTIAKFYIASLMLCIEYLHIRNIIYRDLKPENVMVEADGYLRLIDMGTAKQLKQSSGFRTFTIIGTPHYMAPEVMQGKGYSFSVDIWSLGVLLYEFFCGHLPFGEDIQDPYELHRVVMKDEIKYPTFFSDIKAKSLIEQMLQKRAETRINRGFAALKASPFFDGFDWEALYEKRMKSPYIPKKLKQPSKVPPDGGSFLQFIAKEKLKLPPSKESKLQNWDAEF